MQNVNITGNVSQTGAKTLSTGTGAIALNGDVTLAANKNISSAAGTGAVDLSLMTGTIKTPAGAHTIGGPVTLAENAGITSFGSGTAGIDFSGTTGAFKTGSGDIALNGNITTAANINVTATAGTTAVDLSAGTGVFKTPTGAIALNGDVTLAADKNISATAGTTAVDLSAGTGVFKTPTGANTLSGNVTVDTNKNLTMLGTGNLTVVGGATSLGGTLAVTGAVTLTNNSIAYGSGHTEKWYKKEYNLANGGAVRTAGGDSLGPIASGFNVGHVVTETCIIIETAMSVNLGAMLFEIGTNALCAFDAVGGTAITAGATLAATNAAGLDREVVHSANHYFSATNTDICLTANTATVFGANDKITVFIKVANFGSTALP
jgi:hypothetical protein